MPEADAAGEPRHDVVVVGAGAVGLLLGWRLAQRGLDVVVLERRAARTGRSRAIGIHPPGLRALARAGIEAEVLGAAALVRDGRATCAGRTLGTMSFERGGPVLSLPQLEVEAMLERRLEALRPGAVRRGIEVVEVDDRGVDVRLVGVPVAAGAGAAGEGPAEAGWPELRRVETTTRYAVGADGVRSGIRESLGLGWRGRSGRAHYVMCDTSDETGEPSTALLHFEPAGVVESFPMPGRTRRWVARVRRPPARLTAETVAAIVRSRVDGGRFDVAAAGEPSAFEARQHLAERMSVGRIALAGDAAHEISPIGGQGMNLGWLDAVRLDHELAAALAVGAPFEAFEVYDRVRRAAARRAVRRATFNMSVGAPASGLRLRLRNTGVRMLDVPPLRAVLARAFTMRGL
ncbi:NAD(P)/FAD-dependent oxidoreductase [Agromyces terreus]|uniref:FAD-dependent oxidoreductase n=1 Tax=Agromyces terreus TaxID=424795 RepID=UPI0031D7E4B1